MANQRRGLHSLRFLDESQLHHSGGRVRWPRLFKVRQVDAAGRLALLRPRLGPPKAIVGETVREVAKADLGAVFRSQSSETIGPPPRTDAASDSDDDKG